MYIFYILCAFISCVLVRVCISCASVFCCAHIVYVYLVCIYILYVFSCVLVRVCISCASRVHLYFVVHMLHNTHQPTHASENNPHTHAYIHTRTTHTHACTHTHAHLHIYKRNAYDYTHAATLDAHDGAGPGAHDEEGGSVQLPDVCYRPFTDGACAVQSVAQYWAMNREVYRTEQVCSVFALLMHIFRRHRCA